MSGVTTRERRVDRGLRQAAADLQMLGREFREARIAANLSQGQVGRLVGISPSGVGRIERAVAPNVPLSRLMAIASVLGLKLSVRVYPAGLPLRDAGQIALLERLHAAIHSSLTWRTEVPVPIGGDLRAWDAGISGAGWVAYVDAETRIRDAQALARRLSLKQRDSATDRVILLVADTRSNRALLRVVGAMLVQDAIDGREILRALAAGRDPGGGGVVLL